MSIQLSEGSLVAILSGENVIFPKLQILQLRKVRGCDESERHQLILSDGINYYGLALIGIHLNILITTGDIQKFTVIKMIKYAVDPGRGQRKQKIICIFDLDVISKGNEIGHIIGNPSRLKCSFATEQMTEEDISENTRVLVKSTIDLHAAGPSGITSSTSQDLMASPINEEWIALKPNTQLLIVGASHMQISNSLNIMESPTQKEVVENGNVPEVNTMHIDTSVRVTPSQERTDENCIPIFTVTPYLTKWTIKAWVSNKSSVYYWKNKQGKTFTVDLIDESGDIQATAFNECCDIFCDRIEVNKSYYISNCKVVSANQKYTSIKYEYQLIFTEHTIITPRNEKTSKMPSPCYNFQSIGNICNIPLDKCIDVLGVCKSILDVTHVQLKASLSKVKKQDIVLVDRTNTEVIFTLWESHAGTFNECQNQVIAIRAARISEFMGMRSISLTFSSSVKINPDIPLAHELKNWFDNIGWIQLSASVSKSPVKESEGPNSYKTLRDLELYNLKGMKQKYFNCSAFIVILKRSDVIYKACPSMGCNKKLIELGEKFWCDYCEKEFTSFKWKMILSVKIADFTGQVWVTCFHEVAERLLNVTADELSRITDKEEEYNQVFQNVTFKYFNFILQKRMDTYKGEERFKVVAVKVQRLNYIEHNRKLIQELRLNNQCTQGDCVSDVL